MKTLILFFLACVLNFNSVAHAEDNITFIGNSLTRHLATPKIGWDGNWGMAASAEEKDYVHQLVQQVNFSSGRNWNSTIIAASSLEKNLFLNEKYLTELFKTINSDQKIIILQIGDNINYNGLDLVDFASKYGTLLSSIKPKLMPGGLLLCLGKWWKAPQVDVRIKAECEAAGGQYVDLLSISSQAGAYASTERSFSSPAVARHPGDRAMSEIATHIYQAILKHNPALVKN